MLIHGHCRRGGESLEHRSWANMKARCQNPNHSQYKDYGGRGIIVCRRWLCSFENFFADMGERLGPEYSIDRTDNDGNYEPSNCQWSTKHEQQINSRPKSCGPNKQKRFQAISPKEEIFCSNNQHQFAKEHGLRQGDISSCLAGRRKTCQGWTFTRIEEKII